MGHAYFSGSTPIVPDIYLTHHILDFGNNWFDLSMDGEIDEISYLVDVLVLIDLICVWVEKARNVWFGWGFW